MHDALHDFAFERYVPARIARLGKRCHPPLITVENKRLLIDSIDSNDHSPAKEYRIVGKSVEVRTLGTTLKCEPDSQDAWWRLTPDQLRVHVERKTFMAQWLERRMGWRNLLRACVGEELGDGPRDQQSDDRQGDEARGS